MIEFIALFLFFYIIARNPLVLLLMLIALAGMS